MARIHVDSLDDPRLASFRNLPDRELAREGGLFIAEGALVTRRLLASGLGVHSVLATPRRAAQVEPLLDERAPLYVAAAELVNAVVGFRFHSGILAVGVRPAPPRLDEVVARAPAPIRLLILPRLINTANLGAIVRTAAALGVDGIVLGPACCDPFYRQAVRQSMGAVFNLPLLRPADLDACLLALQREHALELIATVLDEAATALPQCPRPRRLGLLLGSEDHGLDPAVLARCDRRVTLPMQRGTDSLNVAASAAVFLYHFTLAAGP